MFVLTGLVMAAFGLIPIATIWTLNTLFDTGIEYTMQTWLAALLLAMAVGGSASRK